MVELDTSRSAGHRPKTTGVRGSLGTPMGSAWLDSPYTEDHTYARLTKSVLKARTGSKAPGEQDALAPKTREQKLHHTIKVYGTAPKARPKSAGSNYGRSKLYAPPHVEAKEYLYAQTHHTGPSSAPQPILQRSGGPTLPGQQARSKDHAASHTHRGQVGSHTPRGQAESAGTPQAPTDDPGSEENAVLAARVRQLEEELIALKQFILEQTLAGANGPPGAKGPPLLPAKERSVERMVSAHHVLPHSPKNPSRLGPEMHNTNVMHMHEKEQGGNKASEGGPLGNEGGPASSMVSGLELQLSSPRMPGDSPALSLKDQESSLVELLDEHHQWLSARGLTAPTPDQSRTVSPTRSQQPSRAMSREVSPTRATGATVKASAAAGQGGEGRPPPAPPGSLAARRGMRTQLSVEMGQAQAVDLHKLLYSPSEASPALPSPDLHLPSPGTVIRSIQQGNKEKAQRAEDPAMAMDASAAAPAAVQCAPSTESGDTSAAAQPPVKAGAESCAALPLKRQLSVEIPLTSGDASTPRELLEQMRADLQQVCNELEEDSTSPTKLCRISNRWTEYGENGAVPGDTATTSSDKSPLPEVPVPQTPSRLRIGDVGFLRSLAGRWRNRSQSRSPARSPRSPTKARSPRTAVPAPDSAAAAVPVGLIVAQPACNPSTATAPTATTEACIEAVPAPDTAVAALPPVPIAVQPATALPAQTELRAQAEVPSDPEPSPLTAPAAITDMCTRPKAAEKEAREAGAAPVAQALVEDTHGGRDTAQGPAMSSNWCSEGDRAERNRRLEARLREVQNSREGILRWSAAGMDRQMLPIQSAAPEQPHSTLATASVPGYLAGTYSRAGTLTDSGRRRPMSTKPQSANHASACQLQRSSSVSIDFTARSAPSQSSLPRRPMSASVPGPPGERNWGLRSVLRQSEEGIKIIISRSEMAARPRAASAQPRRVAFSNELVQDEPQREEFSREVVAQSEPEDEAEVGQHNDGENLLRRRRKKIVRKKSASSNKTPTKRRPKSAPSKRRPKSASRPKSAGDAEMRTASNGEDQQQQELPSEVSKPTTPTSKESLQQLLWDDEDESAPVEYV